MAPRRSFDGKVASPRGLLPSCLLLLLAEQDGHGYELIGRLRDFGFDHDDPSPVYAELRSLEAAGFVQSRLGEQAGGPPPRSYRLTLNGRDLLGQSASSVTELLQRLQHYLDRYGRLTYGGSSGGRPAVEHPSVSVAFN